MTYPSLLPSNRSEWATALSETGAARYPLPAELVASVWSPADCPVHILPYLAWALSVDLWDDTWPETLKREACRRALELHRLKTTLAGVKAHVELVGAEVRKVTRPPANGFMYAAMTPEQRLAWLDSLPQIRIYPFYNKAIAKSRMFFSGTAGKKFMPTVALNSTSAIEWRYNGLIPQPEVVNSVTDVTDWTYSPIGQPQPALRVVSRGITGFYRPSRGETLLGRRSTYFKDGVEIEARYEARDGDDVERVFVPATRNRQWYGAAFAGHGHATASKGASGAITLRLDNSGNFFAIESGASVQDVRPQRINQERIAPIGTGFSGRFANKRFMRSTFAPLLVYDRISLQDDTRIGGRRKTRRFYGHGRFGISPYTAELKIHVPMRRPRRTSARWHGVGHMKGANMAPLYKAIEAVRVSKAFRDTVYIDTASYGEIQFSGGLQFGEFAFGEIKEVA